MYKLPIESLEPGMVLYDDLYTPEKFLIYKANTCLTNEIISIISDNHIKDVSLCEPSEINMTHYEYIHKSSRFKTFMTTYNNNLNAFQKMMRNLDTGLELNLMKLLSLRDEVLATVIDCDQLLDYLYNMMPNENTITYNHCFNCGFICYVFGSWIGIDGEDLDNLSIAGFMFDIGKTKVSDNILWKPDKLTPFEYEQVKQHIKYGYNLIKGRKLPAHVEETIMMHHERCDGSGYPNKLTGENIDSFALIAAIADTYEAMTHPRAQRLALTPFQAIRVFEEQGFELYGDNALPILKHLASMYIGRRAMINRTLPGVILEINEDSLSRPTLLSNGKNVDLRAMPNVAITRML